MEFDLNKKICYYFKQISDIPRASRNEKAVSDYIVEFAKQHHYEYKQDEVYNVIVYKPASVGYEDAAPVILQAHTDMVCEKNKDIEHDFEKDPLDLYVEDGWLKARGTTLGADDGQGVAYMLAILDDDTLKHPALECAFTVMEEIGLLGAKALKAEDFSGKRYINLDSGGEVATTVSSAGGARALMKRDLHFNENHDPAYRLEVRGLEGGHSGACAHLERGNAIIIASRIMEKLCHQYNDISLNNINGGMKFNAIPRECDVTFTSKEDPEHLKEIADKIISEIKEELQYSDDGFFCHFVSCENIDKAISPKDTKEIFDFLYVIPNGFMHRSMAIEGLTVASLNAGVALIENDQLCISELIRSAASSHGDQMIRQLEILCDRFGFVFDLSNRYYGWNYDKNSPLRKIYREVLNEKGLELKENASHGGLECGVFKGMIPDLDIITLGPIAQGAHTPEEKMNLASFDRAYQYLVDILERCR